MMREEYYTPENIDAQAKDFLAEVARYTKRFPIKKNACALLVIDMQKEFVDRNGDAFVPSSPAIVPRIVRLQKAFFKLGLPVVHTRHINTEEDAGQMARWWRDLITEDDPFSCIVSDIVDDRAKLIKKSQYDAFWNTELHEYLRDSGVEQVVITGVMANLCCETTARSAFVRGFEVFFVIDGTAGYNREFHLATIVNLCFGFATPVLVKDVLRGLGVEDEE